MNQIKTIFLLICLTTSSLAFAAKPIGAACMVDGQCSSGECKSFKCVKDDINAPLTGNKIINNALNKFKMIEPLLLSAGFEVEEIRVQIRLIPQVVVYIKQITKFTRDEQKKLLKGLQGNVYFYALLKSLFTAHAFEFNNYIGDQSIVTLLPPGVELRLRKK
jgi:hypothetical protein